jgi:hypothetical protein
MPQQSKLLLPQANILQPLTDLGTLALRQDALGELLAAGELLHDARQCLAALPRDLDRMCAGLVRNCLYLPKKYHHWASLQSCAAPLHNPELALVGASDTLFWHQLGPVLGPCLTVHA